MVILCRDPRLQTSLTLVFWIFLGVALMVFVLERYARPTDEEATARLSSWLVPLVGLLLLLRVLEHYLFAG